MKKTPFEKSNFNHLAILLLTVFAAFFLFSACAEEKEDEEKDYTLNNCDGSTTAYVSETLEYHKSINDERIYLSKTLGDKIGAVVGQQIRLYPEGETDKPALFTIEGWHDSGNPGEHIWMDKSGWSRLKKSSSFSACVDGEAIKYDLPINQLEANNEFSCYLEESNTSHTSVMVGAPHGGNIEVPTHDQAAWFYDWIANDRGKNVSAWYCAGYHSALKVFAAWHITSTDVSRTSFKLLDQIADRGFTYAVSFHGFSQDYYLIGGSAPDALKQEVKTAIENVVGNNYNVLIAKPGESYAGMDPNNFVNWMTTNGAGGIQIEQPRAARTDRTNAEWVAKSVAEVFAKKQ